MKKKLVPVIVVVALFAAFGLFAMAGGNSNASSDDANAAAKDKANAVKICPHSGLPCTGDGDCDDECEDE